MTCVLLINHYISLCGLKMHGGWDILDLLHQIWKKIGTKKNNHLRDKW